MDEKEKEEVAVQLWEAYFGERRTWSGALGSKHLQRKISEIHEAGFKNGFLSGAAMATVLLVLVMLIWKG